MARNLLFGDQPRKAAMAYMLRQTWQDPRRVRAPDGDARECEAPDSGVFARRARTTRIRLVPERTVGAFEVGLLLVSVVLFCIAVGHASPARSPAVSWLFTSCLLWLCTCPAWVCRPNRYEIKRLFVAGTIAFISIGAAVFVGTALNAQLTHGLL
jgi:hypothetical protein